LSSCYLFDDVFVSSPTIFLHPKSIGSSITSYLSSFPSIGI